MHPRFEQRLGRVRADALREEAAISDRRTGLEAQVAVSALLRRMLAERGVDPAQVKALRRFDQAAAQLAALPERTAPQMAEAAMPAEAGGENPIELLLRRLARLAEANFADGRRPDPERSSPAEWLAWCLFTPAAGDTEPGDMRPLYTSSPSMGRPGRGDTAEGVEYAPIGSNDVQITPLPRKRKPTVENSRGCSGPPPSRKRRVK